MYLIKTSMFAEKNSPKSWWYGKKFAPAAWRVKFRRIIDNEQRLVHQGVSSKANFTYDLFAEQSCWILAWFGILKLLQCYQKLVYCSQRRMHRENPQSSKLSWDSSNWDLLDKNEAKLLKSLEKSLTEAEMRRKWNQHATTVSKELVQRLMSRIKRKTREIFRNWFFSLKF